MSNVGKSVLVAGLCRALTRRGLRVAPFKSQNMALNSAVTPDGLEIGRAQALQARACGISPTADMNPILLKPTSDCGSQVIVRGVARKTMEAGEYFTRRAELIPLVRESYERLAATHDVVVIEGAGSPVEINLRANDIANMGMARIAQCPVILVGDIDPGGVFAQLAGTLDLLTSDERAMVRGLVINKFRGQRSLLDPGIVQLEEICKKPVLGVVPYLRLDLDEEDSLSSKINVGIRGTAPLDVAVVRLPHMANYTDFDSLAADPDVDVRYVATAAHLGRPDLLVVPGTKATIEDLGWLCQSGIASCLLALANSGTPVLGICGGYQMLGERIIDPEGFETAGSVRGLGLLPVGTVFEQSKELGWTEADVAMALTGPLSALAGRRVRGYEIHMGRTEPMGGAAGAAIMACGDGRVVGWTRGNVMGTYLHGLLDDAATCAALVDALMGARGLARAQRATRDRGQVLDRELDRLADALEDSLDMAQVLRIIEEGL